MATHGHLKNSNGSTKEGSSALPESSLTWCISQLSKVSLAASNQSNVSQETEPKNKEGRDKTRDIQKKLQASQWRALVAIRTQHIKGGDSRINRFRTQGGLPPLLDLLRRPDSSRKTLDLALSILANCCTEREARREVRKLEGITVIVDVMKRNVAVETLENRGARALGNLAMDPDGSALVHSAGGVPPLLLCLSLSPSTPSSSSSPNPSSPSSPSSVSPSSLPSSAKLECAQSAARALLYLADTPANRLSLLSQGAMPALAPLMSPELPLGLRRASLRALHELTRGCGAECAREVSRSGALAQLGALVSEEAAKPLEELALKTLANLCSQGCLRPLVGSLGAIQKFSEEVKKDPSKSGVLLKALCLCCKEAVNRVKVKESGGLEVLIGFLSAHQNHPLTRLAILACVDFVYDESALEQLQDLGLIPLLVARLVEYAKGEEPVAKSDSSPSSASDLMSPSCFDSFDFPHPDGNKKDDVGKEQGSGSSSFLSLRSWLVSEGLISSEGELLESPASTESDCGGSLASSPSVATSPFTPISDASSSGTCLSPTSSVHSQSSVSSVSKPGLLPPLNQLTVPHSSQRNVPLSPSNPQSPPLCTSGPKPTSPSKVCSPPKKRPRVSSLSSSSSHSSASSFSSSTCSSVVSLDAPPVLSRTPAYHHPYHPEPWAPESPILLLLSRFSHASDPSATLVNSGVLSSLLYYLTHHKDPSGRCFRMLSRLSCNPNCLQALLRTGAVSMIHQDLCLRGSSIRVRRGQERQTDRVKAKVRQLGLGLLSNLRVQCEAGFGTGVMSHIMLSGIEVDRLFCALSLPLICSNKVLLKKLLFDNRGLMQALEPLCCQADSKDDNNHPERCKTFLSCWLCPPQEVTLSRFHLLYSSLLIGCLSNLLVHSKAELDQKKGSVEPQVTVETPLSPNTALVPLKGTGNDLPPSPKKPCLSSSCSYADATHNIFLQLDDGTQVPACWEALAGGEGESGDGGSEYFRALLTGGFGEAQGKEGEAILVKDVRYGVLIPVLHYLHGCRLTDRERGQEQEEDTGEGGRGRCCLLESLTLKSWDSPDFQKTALAEGMVGACRFLVTGLQRATEDMCVTLLHTLATKPASLSLPQRSPKPVPGGIPRPLQSSKVVKSPLQSGPKSTPKTVKQNPKVGSSSEVEQVPRTPLKLPQDTSSSATEGTLVSNCTLAPLLPQLYWFSQRYNYPRLGRACLSILLRPQGVNRMSPAASLPPVQAADCLLRLVKHADCQESLKRDLLGLAAAALS
ncbi:hypothetical protein AALO_G00080490 [Alosa alosa]|uniref:BTB domain-containing protein n=1 Tax=Alosa alosa TaxID=278164 RepID=A0AAV6H2U7_9TELE|nr:armadillo repeat-containing protein 5 [Alosa alosa]KAG5279686.1 hypothetical protein AALO_G00080490 [Alosa alosa]